MIMHIIEWAAIIYLFIELKKLKDIHKGHPDL